MISLYLLSVNTYVIICVGPTAWIRTFKGNTEKSQDRGVQKYFTHNTRLVQITIEMLGFFFKSEQTHPFSVQLLVMKWCMWLRVVIVWVAFNLEINFALLWLGRRWSRVWMRCVIRQKLFVILNFTERWAWLEKFWIRIKHD